MNIQIGVNDFFTVAAPALLAAGGLLVLILQLILPKHRTEAAFWVTVLTLGTGIFFGLTPEAWPEALIPFILDGNVANITSGTLVVSGFMEQVMMSGYVYQYTILIMVAMLAIVLIGKKVLREANLNMVEVYMLYLFSGTGLLLLVSAADLMTLFLGLELSSLPMYVLAGFSRKDKRSSEAGLKYFLLSAFSSAFLLLGIALLYGSSGSTNLNYIYASQTGSLSQTLSVLGWSMLLLALAFKVALFPAHGWVADVYEGSTTIFTAFLAALVKIAAVGAFFRVSEYIPVTSQAVIAPALTIFLIASMFYGNIAALAQSNLKRVFAFSSIAHAGYMGTMFVLPTTEPVDSLLRAEASASLFFYVAGYAMTTILIFSLLAYMEKNESGEGGVTWDSLKGLSKRSPWAAYFLSIASLSFAGIPPLLGFFGKYYILRVLVKEELLLLALMLSINSMIGVYYYAKVVFYSYWDFEDETSDNTYKPAFRGNLAQITASVLSFMILLLGVISGNLYQVAFVASRAFR